jgi:hypothetical protein
MGRNRNGWELVVRQPSIIRHGIGLVGGRSGGTAVDHTYQLFRRRNNGRTFMSYLKSRSFKLMVRFLGILDYYMLMMMDLFDMRCGSQDCVCDDQEWLVHPGGIGAVLNRSWPARELDQRTIVAHFPASKGCFLFKAWTTWGLCVL